jgi:DNA-binding Lrp family transcriptional regulator
LEFSESEELFYVFLFLRVPAPGSGDLVSKLEEIPTVIEAAAVYSDYDVIACLCGKPSQIGHSILKISSISSVKDQKLLVVHKDSELSKEQTDFDNDEYIHSYIVIELNPNVDAYSVANKINKKHNECVYAIPIEKENEVIARVKTRDKKSFDDLVMNNIQGTPGVTTTKSYMVIVMKDMCFCRPPINGF